VRRKRAAVLHGRHVQRAEHVRERHVCLVRSCRGTVLPGRCRPALFHSIRPLLQRLLSARGLPDDHDDDDTRLTVRHIRRCLR
jgi:hypothetical protein